MECRECGGAMSEEARYRCQSCKHLDFWWHENIGRRHDVAVGICHAPGVGTCCPIGLAKAEGRCELYEERDVREGEEER